MLTEFAEQRRNREAHGECPGGHDREEGNDMCELSESPTDGRREEESAERQQKQKRCVLGELRGRLAAL